MMTLLVEPALIAETDQIQKPQYGGTLRLPSAGKPAPLDPFNVTDTISVALLDLVYSKLIRGLAQDGFEGDLAKGWKISEDGLTYTFHLRPGVTFHDGAPCTAEDVAYSFQLYSNKTVSPTYYRYFEKVEQWEAISDQVFRVKLKEPFPPFLFVIFKIRIVPKHKLTDLQDIQRFVEQPLGTGPFKFDGRGQSGNMIFASNKDYFEGRPYLDRIEIIPVEKDRVCSAFLRGEIDMTYYDSREHCRDVQNNPSFEVHRSLSTFGYILIFNFKNELLQDKRIREAVSYAVDRKRLMEQMEEGEGALTSGPFHPESWAYDSAIPPSPYEPARAVSLLKEAGFVKRDGVWERKGEPLILEITVDRENNYLYRLAKLIRQQLHEIGIRADFAFYSDYSELNQKVYEDGDFQTFLMVYHAGPEPDVTTEYWHSYTRRAYNIGGYYNLVVENLLDSAKKTVDEKKRREIYHRVHRLIDEDKPALFLYFPYVFFALADRVQMPEPLFSSAIPFYAFKDVFINEAMNERG